MTVVLNLVAGGGNRHINNTSKKRGKNEVGKPVKTSGKSGNKVNQIAANFNQNIDDDKTRHRSKSVGMSTGAKVGSGVGGTLVTGGAATGLGLGIRHLIRKYGKCDLLRNYSLDCINSSDLDSWDEVNYKISFVHDYKDSKNYKGFVLNFLLVKNEYNVCFLIYKITENSIKNGAKYGPYITKDGGLQNLPRIVFEKLKSPNGEFSLSSETSPYGKIIDNVATRAFDCAAGKLADIVVEGSKDKSDDREINVAYKTHPDMDKLKKAMKNRLLEELGDSSNKLVFTNIGYDLKEFDVLKQSGWSVIELK